MVTAENNHGRQIVNALRFVVATLTLMATIGFTGLSGCSDDDAPSTSEAGDSDTSAASDVRSDANTVLDTGSDTSTVSDTGTGTDGETHVDSEGDADTIPDGETVPDTDIVPDVDTVLDADIGTTADATTEADVVMDTDDAALTDDGADPDADGGSVTPPGGFIADHLIAKESVLRRIPDSAINAARQNLHILYCGTSHSTQVMTGMAGLVQYKTGDDTLFAFTTDGVPVPGSLDIHYNGADGTDLSADSVDGDGHTGYFRGTVTYLDSHDDVNVVMWSWCSIEDHDVQVYLDNFEELIDMYSAGGSKGRTAENAVTFVFMSGYARGSDGDDPTAEHSPYNNAMAIRAYCEEHDQFLLDYWSQDVYDYATDAYNPDESGNANVQHFNYCDSHTVGEDWYECRDWNSGAVEFPAHTEDNPTYAQHLTGNRRAYAAWWIWARIAGWDGTLE